MSVYDNQLISAARWNFFQPKEGDLIVATYPKSGTTWMQNILLHLVASDFIQSEPLWKLSPRIERNRESIQAVMAFLDKQAHRRVLKTHLPYDRLPFFSKAKYIIVVRDLRDVAISLWNFYNNLSDEILLAEGVVLAASFGEFWSSWTGRGAHPEEGDGFPFQSPTHFLRTWWSAKDHPNVHIVHYDDLLWHARDEVQKLCRFVGDVDEDRIAEIIGRTSFDSMKRDSEKMFRGEILKGGSDSFFRSGTSGQWKTLLNEEQLGPYRRMVESLPSDCREWLERERHG